MKILFICTHNRCRSILGEAITNHIAQGKLQAVSAGSQPAGQVHPLSLRYLEERGIPNDGLKSQSWDEFEAFEPDIVFTVCDSAAQEQCPVWFGKTIKVHWGLPDPSRLEGSEDQIKAAFFRVMDTIETRIKKLMALDYENMDTAALTQALVEIAEQDHGTV